MGDGETRTNAMAEIALALAMGFFSIMVLTMVSMGAGLEPDPRNTAATDDAPRLDRGVAVAPAAPRDGASGAAAGNKSAAAAETPSRPSILVYYRGRFFDGSLKPADPLVPGPEGWRVLAVDPALPMAEILKVRSKVGEGGLTVTVLGEDWLAALKKEVSK
jgi:hypothetical protein